MPWWAQCELEWINSPVLWWESKYKSLNIQSSSPAVTHIFINFYVQLLQHKKFLASGQLVSTVQNHLHRVSFTQSSKISSSLAVTRIIRKHSKVAEWTIDCLQDVGIHPILLPVAQFINNPHHITPYQTISLPADTITYNALETIPRRKHPRKTLQRNVRLHLMTSLGFHQSINCPQAGHCYANHTSIDRWCLQMLFAKYSFRQEPYASVQSDHGI